MMNYHVVCEKCGEGYDARFGCLCEFRRIVGGYDTALTEEDRKDIAELDRMYAMEDPR